MAKLDDGLHRSAETRLRFACDVNLRMHGFKIHSRPSGRPSLWERGGRLYTVAEAAREVGLRFRESD